jgi:acyl-CoA thioesterase-1
MNGFSHHWTRLVSISPLGRLILLTFCLFFSLAVAQANTSAANLDRPILIVGDSLSSEYGISRQTGWVQLMRNRLQELYTAPPNVINASISGDTTSGGVTRLPTLLEKHAPGLVVIELGGNDALRGLSLDMTLANLTQMIELAQQAGAVTVLTGIQIPSNYGLAYTNAFKNLYLEVAQATGSELVPFLLAGLETDRNLFIEDGIHPSETAQPILLNNVWSTLETILPAPDKTSAGQSQTDQLSTSKP